jgi:hypothetical protein
MEKEIVKQEIRDLANKIKESEEEWEWESYEMDIAVLIIDYSIAHGIVIPVIDYDRYKALFEPIKKVKEQEEGSSRRIKIDREGDEGNPEYNFMEDFFEAIGEETLINPRFELHPEIKELIESWSNKYET